MWAQWNKKKKTTKTTLPGQCLPGIGTPSNKNKNSKGNPPFFFHEADLFLLKVTTVKQLLPFSKPPSPLSSPQAASALCSCPVSLPSLSPPRGTHPGVFILLIHLTLHSPLECLPLGCEGQKFIFAVPTLGQCKPLLSLNKRAHPHRCCSSTQAASSTQVHCSQVPEHSLGWAGCTWLEVGREAWNPMSVSL